MAEAQAAEEARRRDPVKLGIWVAGFCVLVVVIWIGKIQLDISYANTQLAAITADWRKAEPNYNMVTNFFDRKTQVNSKLDSLDQLSTNRFLWAPVLNALQQTVVDNIEVTHVIGSQSFVVQDASFVGSGSTKKMLPAKTIEKIKLTIDARDYNPQAEGYSTYKESLCNFDFFVKALGRRDGFVLDGALGQKLADPTDPSKQFQNFTLATHFREMTND
jgi:hypothetical protein